MSLNLDAFEETSVADTSIATTLDGAFFAATVDEEVSWLGPSMIFARLFLEGGFFELGCFFLKAITTMTTIQSTNMMGGTLYMSTRHRLLNSFISSLFRKLSTQLIKIGGVATARELPPRVLQTGVSAAFPDLF